jgi:Cys-rich repeat protein
MRMRSLVFSWGVIAVAAAALGTSAGCSSEPTATKTSRLRKLDANRAHLLVERMVPKSEREGEDGPIIIPEPGDCPVMEWRETHTVLTDSNGEVISESWQVCTQCFEKDGTTPIGEESCTDEPPVPPDVICEEYPSTDPTQVCYRCTTPDGTVVEDSCAQLPVECTTDKDCPDGEICYLDIVVPVDPGCGDGGETPPPPPPVGYCAAPDTDPCHPVDSLPDDPNGQDCYVCDGLGTGLPERGDKNGGGKDDGSYGWCNVHTCASDADCAARGETCDVATGLCAYVDPCTSVDSLPSDPTGSDCYQCTDPATGEDWGSYCNVHSCSADDDCVSSGYGDLCIEGTCTWKGYDDGGKGDGGKPPTPSERP